MRLLSKSMEVHPALFLFVIVIIIIITSI